MGRVSINVSGIVQGVGFRPYVFRLARRMGLKGFVQNTGGGVLIEVEGGKEDTQGFMERLKAEAPPLASITALDIRELPHEEEYADFRIIESEVSPAQSAPFAAEISVDVSVCPECLAEMSNPKDRRYLYPFINCTNCGPRYSIITETPYDRENTTMSAFRMCPECKREYTDPANRRFHAEPVACPACGPSLSIERALSINGAKSQAPSDSPSGDPIAFAVRALKEGGIVAIKGLGGFHLACDAANETAVRDLRRRKKRGNKPFALMAASMEEIKLFCHVSAGEEQKLLSPERPVVLLRKKDGCPLPSAIAPGNGRLGFMLPYTPLHWLLFNYPGPDGKRTGTGFHALVMTSGNLSDEPIVIGNDDALKRLSGIAGHFVLHDRDIHNRVDDSVIYEVSPGGGPPFFVFARRARGYAPGSISLGGAYRGRKDFVSGKFAGPQVMGAGGDLKNTFTLAKDGKAVMSQHIGDMENPRAQKFYLETLEKLMRLFRIRPEAVGYDMHPGYHSSNLILGNLILELDGGLDMPRKFAVQHHHAHIASVMAEAGLTGKVIGVALDGTGYGTDGTLWGGEFLIADAAGFERAAHFRPIPLPGAEAAVREPWRAAIGLLGQAFPDEMVRSLARKSGITGRHTEPEVENILRLSKKPELSPLSSGAGRLFEAFSSVLGLVDVNTFEAEAAIALESISEDFSIKDEYPYDIVDGRGEKQKLDFSAAFVQAIEEKARGAPAGVISARFHNTVARAVSETALRLSAETGIKNIVLGGGVFQNRFLTGRVIERLSLACGIRVHTNRLVPPGDGGISLGQAFIARERFLLS